MRHLQVRRGRLAGLLVALAMTATACGSAGRGTGASPTAIGSTVPGPSTASSASASPTSSSPPTSGGTTADQPCGTSAAAPAQYDHVIWVIFENHGTDAVLGSANAPYINRLADACGSATNYHGVAHPSLPNYIAMTSGSTAGITDDDDPATHSVDGPSLFAQAQDWRTLQEGMTKPCLRSNTGKYAVKHNPAAYYTGLAAECAARDTAFTNPPDLSARFTFVTPDLCHDMHDCGVRAGDDWLASWLPAVLGGPQYQAGSTAIVVTFDEDEGDSGQRVPFVSIAPTIAAGTVVDVNLDHYALLRTTQDLLGLSRYLGAARTAPSLRPVFRF